MFYKELRLISGMRFGSWLLKKIFRGNRFFIVVVHACAKSLTKQGVQKKCVPGFPVLSALKNYLHVYL